jgi:hypothetical protein
MSSFFSGFGSGSGGSGIQILTGDTGSATGTTVYIAGGTGISTSASGSTVTISATGVTTFNYTSVTTTPYVVLSTDDFLGVTTSSLAITIQLPNAPATGRVFTVKDNTGASYLHNITVTTVGGTVNIDSATTYVMNSSFEAAQFLFNGTEYLIF